MGEGWARFLWPIDCCRRPDEDVNGVYAMGGYVTLNFADGLGTDNYYYGIRRFPYAVKTNARRSNGKPHNPLTFGRHRSAANQRLATARILSRVRIIHITANEVHNIGTNLVHDGVGDACAHDRASRLGRR